MLIPEIISIKLNRDPKNGMREASIRVGERTIRQTEKVVSINEHKKAMQEATNNQSQSW